PRKTPRRNSRACRASLPLMDRSSTFRSGTSCWRRRARRAPSSIPSMARFRTRSTTPTSCAPGRPAAWRPTRPSSARRRAPPPISSARSRTGARWAAPTRTRRRRTDRSILETRRAAEPVTDTTPGILAIFNNAAPGREAAFEEWFQHEHLAERIAVPGFRLGRRYEAVSGSPRYFNFYLTESVDVLKSAPYLARLDDPTPMTRMIMSEVFKDMIRTVCHRTFRLGTMRGA